MADIATNQHIIEIRHVKRNGESSTPSPVETPRVEVNPQPADDPSMWGPNYGFTFSNSRNERNLLYDVLLNNIIRALHHQNKVIDEQNKRIEDMGESWTKEAQGTSHIPRQAVQSPTP